jgi:hypothetical protein
MQMKQAAEIRALVEAEIERITQPDLVEAVRKQLIPPRCEERPWDYAEDQTYPCWLVAEHPESNTAIAYCEQGFGSCHPWGLLFISGPNMGMGMDSNWFISLEQSFRESPGWQGTNPPGYEVD